MESRNYTYKFNHKKRGRAIIIVNGDFKEYFDDPILVNGKLVREDTGLAKRYCATNEMKLMKKFFQTLGFNTKCYKDVSAHDIKRILKQAAANEEKKHRQKKEADCFACVICSHGIQGEPESEPGSNIKYRPHGVAGIDGYFVLTEDIISYFQESECPSLRNKPKLFFFQACRSNVDAETEDEKFDIGIPIKILDSEDELKPILSTDIPDDAQRTTGTRLLNLSEAELSDADTDSETDDQDYILKSEQLSEIEDMGIQKVPGDLRDLDDNFEAQFGQRNNDSSTSEVAEVTTVPCHTDMLLMFATSEGKFAFSSGEGGGWLVQYLCETMDIYGVEQMDFLTFLNMVTYETVQNRSFRPPPPEDKYDTRGRRRMCFYGSKVTPFITHRLRGDIYFNDSKMRSRKSVLSKIKKLLK